VTGGKEGYLPYSAVALQILIFFLPFSFVNGVTQYVLIALDRQRLITGAFALTLVFNVAANLAFVPLLGINGAAIVTVLSEIVLLVPFAIWIRRELALTGERITPGTGWKPLVAGVVTGALMYLLWAVFEDWNSDVGSMALYVGAGVLLAGVYGGVLWVLRPFTQHEAGTLRSALRRTS
jgi:O-antigen/teichoic acid export membrane protein